MHLLEPLGSLVGPPLFFSIKAGAETLLANFTQKFYQNSEQNPTPKRA